jgi:hypothetical protein
MLKKKIVIKNALFWGCEALQFGGYVPMRRRNTLLPSSTSYILKMEAEVSSETLGIIKLHDVMSQKIVFFLTHRLENFPSFLMF